MWFYLGYVLDRSCFVNVISRGKVLLLFKIPNLFEIRHPTPKYLFSCISFSNKNVIWCQFHKLFGTLCQTFMLYAQLLRSFLLV